MTFTEPNLWHHQKEVIALSKRHSNLAIFHEMGTGKTCSAIQILRHKYAAHGKLLKTLIIAPPITLQNWKREIKKFSKIRETDIYVLAGAGSKRIADFNKVATETDGTLTKPRIIITNYEAMQMDGLFALLKQWQPEVLICDEAHRLRNKDSKRARRVCEIADWATSRYLLTGSPILNSAMDVFYPFRILDKGETFGTNFYAFRAKYFVDENSRWAGRDNYFPKFIPNTNTYEELNKKIYSKAHRVLKKDCLDLPPLIRQVHKIELGEEQKKLYKSMRDEYVAFLEQEKKSGQPIAVVAQLAITKALRLLQIASGFAKAEDGNEYAMKKNPRLDHLKELLEELAPQGKTIVWACFKNNYEQIAGVCKELGLEYAMLHGETKDKNAEIERFTKTENCKVMIANQQAGGIGINLVEAPFAVFYSRNFSLEADMQAEARNYRGGSEIHAKVTRIDLVAPDTIDETVAEALANKINIAEKILAWNKEKEF